MRIVCNLGLRYDCRHELGAALKYQNKSEWALMAQDAFTLFRDMNSVSCHLCSTCLLDSEGLSSEADSTILPYFASCFRFVCSDCAESHGRDRGLPDCGHQSTCSMATVSTNLVALEDPKIPPVLQPGPRNANFGPLPSKVRALVTQLRSLPPGSKR